MALAFLLDVDNTLLDNDALKEFLNQQVEATAGVERGGRFWHWYEVVRQQEDRVDLAITVDRFSEEERDPDIHDRLVAMLRGLPFAEFVYPGAFEALAYLGQLGTTAIVSDGDEWFQPLKIERSGLQAAVNGGVYIYTHKENHLEEIMRALPADGWVMIDDKPRILTAIKELQPALFRTVQVRQGAYAAIGGEHVADVTLSHIVAVPSEPSVVAPMA